MPVENLLPSEVAAQRSLAEESGYVSPYPAPGAAPTSTIDERCETCGWTLFVTLRCEVWCVNAKCAAHHHDLTQEVPDGEPVPVE